ncbi:transporter [Sphingomonas changnyeongensis]|uniref:Transporter n=1 Tax=Sphingomonas changnyeongensis TaxID=2698679 RepID=A0A7Z2NVG0_9SPHN|nr:transporter [Sphingomonas changnyeongensis]QHL90500.1 transporter [Sphingomonas changnyeongensis]
MVFVRSIGAVLATTALAAFPVAASARTAQPIDNVPTSSAPDAPICTDRPTKSNFACTVPKGKWQVESDLYNYSRLSVGGVTTEAELFTSPVLKYGISDSADVNIAWVPYARVTTETGGVRTTADGVGDVVLRVKQRFTPTDRALQFSLIPYVKLPTAPRGIGNREAEGGIIAPANLSLPGSITLTVVPSLDLLSDADGRGHHVQLTGLVNIGKQIGRTTLYGELWTAQNFDPGGTIRQYSADFAVAHLLNDELQLDVGGNFGLNAATPDVQLYAGISVRW